MYREKGVEKKFSLFFHVVSASVFVHSVYAALQRAVLIDEQYCVYELQES